MDKEVIAIFSKIIDNSGDIITEIRAEVYKMLGISTQADKLSEYVKESLETFSFNVVEKQFFEQIRNVVMEEMNKNDVVDFETFSNRLIEKLKGVKVGNLNFDDDFKNLSTQIVSKFPYVNLSIEQLYSHFSSRKEQIISMISQHNQNVIETLIKLTPRLAGELKNRTEANASIVTPQPQVKEVPTNGVLSVEQFLSRCTEKLDEVNLMFQNGGNSKSEIAKGFRQLKSFIENLHDKTFAQSILERYVKLNNAAQGVIYDKIIFENVPMLKDIYEKYDGLLVTSQVEQLKNNLGSVFEEKPTQGPSFVSPGGAIPREPAMVSPRDRDVYGNGVSQTSGEEVVHTEQEKQDIREQLHQAQEEVREKLEWAKQQPNKPKSVYTGDLSNLPDSVKKRIIEQIEKKHGTTISGVENIYQEGNYIVIDARDKNGVFVGTEYSIEDFSNLISQVQSASQEMQPLSSIENSQEQQIKASLVQQIINAMNKSGELSFGEISFNDRMSRMQDIRSRLENKSIEDLQTLLATYQEQKDDTKVVGEVKTDHKVEQAEEVRPMPSVENSQEQQIKASLVQQIINAMNKSGELSFGEISFSDRMSRMQDIRSRLENKSIEDLQTLLATYQEQNLDNEVQQSSPMRR